MPTYTSQPDGASGIDTVIWSNDANTNFGTGTDIRVGENDSAVNEINRALIKFDLSTIPADAVVTSAILTLTIVTDKSSNVRTQRVFRLKRAWTEAGATWNKYDGTNNWQTAGGFGADDCEQTDIGSLSLSASETGAKSWTLDNSAIQEMISGAFTNNGFLIKADTESNDGYRYASSDHATAGSRPKLVIEYTVPQSGGKPIFANFGIV